MSLSMSLSIPVSSKPCLLPKKRDLWRYRLLYLTVEVQGWVKGWTMVIGYDEFGKWPCRRWQRWEVFSGQISWQQRRQCLSSRTLSSPQQSQYICSPHTSIEPSQKQYIHCIVISGTPQTSSIIHDHNAYTFQTYFIEWCHRPLR